MSGELKAIRDAVAERLQTVYAGSVYKSRIVDPRDAADFAKVFITSGAVRQNGMDAPINTRLVISYHHQLIDNDDALDAVMDAIDVAINSSQLLPNLIRGVHFEGFEYVDEENAPYSGLQYIYNVIY